MEESKFNFIKSISERLSAYNIPIEVRCWIGCQFALESNFGKSDLARLYNNYCGMRNPKLRFSVAESAGNLYIHWARYSSLSYCVHDYILCLQYHRVTSVDCDSPEHFASFIKKFYCPEKDYIDKINKIYQQFKIQNNEQNK